MDSRVIIRGRDPPQAATTARWPQPFNSCELHRQSSSYPKQPISSKSSSWEDVSPAGRRTISPTPTRVWGRRPRPGLVGTALPCMPNRILVMEGYCLKSILLRKHPTMRGSSKSRRLSDSLDRIKQSRFGGSTFPPLERRRENRLPAWGKLGEWPAPGFFVSDFM